MLEFRKRSAAIVIHENEILLMGRKKYGKNFFVFPGGFVEDNEDPSITALRELEEETTIKATDPRLVIEHIISENVSQYYYLCKYVSGEPHLPKSSEEHASLELGGEHYDPRFIPTKLLPKLLLFPLEVRDLVIEDIEKGFPRNPHTLRIPPDRLRQTL